MARRTQEKAMVRETREDSERRRRKRDQLLSHAALGGDWPLPRDWPPTS